MSLEVQYFREKYYTKVIHLIIDLVNSIFNGMELIHSWGRKDGPPMNLTFRIHTEKNNIIRYFQHFISRNYIAYYKGSASPSNNYIFRYYQP